MADQLTLAPLIRAGTKIAPRGPGKSERHFLDFVINGSSLWEKIGKRNDTVSILCAEYVPAQTIKALNRLLLTEPTEIPNNRRCVFICSECGDLGCGAVTALITRKGDSIVWEEFGFENNYEPEIRWAGYENVGPFAFDAKEYEQTLREGLERLKGMRV